MIEKNSDINNNSDITPEAENSEAEPQVQPSEETGGEKQESSEPQSTIFTKHVYEDKKPVKKGALKRVLTCVIAVVLCAVIAGSAFLIVKLLPDKDKTASINSNIEAGSIPVLSYDNLVKASNVKIDGKEYTVASNIASFSINNYYESYTFSPYYVKAEKSNATSSSASSSEASSEASSATSSDTSSAAVSYDYDVKWQIKGIDKELTLPKLIENHIKNCLNITATREMANTFGDLKAYYANYGLDAESSTRGIVVEFNDGTEDLVILVGDQIPTGNGNYVTVSGDEKVYVVSDQIIKYFDYLPVDFADKTVVEEITKTDGTKKYFNDANEIIYYDYIKLSGEIVGRQIEFGISDEPSAEHMPYMMTSPYNRPANSEFIGKIIGLAKSGITADGLLTFKATDENIKKCQLNNPKCVIEVKMGDYKFKLIVGGMIQEGSSSLPVMVEGKTQIFYIDQVKFNFITNDIEKMFGTDLVMEDIYTIKAIEFTDSTGKHRFDIKHTPLDEKEDTFTTTITNNGVETNTQSFKYLYQRVLLLSLLDFETKAEKTDVILRVRFIRADTSKDKVLELTASPNDPYHYLAWVDGQVMGEVLKTTADDISESLAKYLKGEELTPTY